MQGVLNFFKKIVSAIEDPRGGLSSKRLYGLGCFIVAVYLAVHGSSDVVVSIFAGQATLILGASAVTKT